MENFTTDCQQLHKLTTNCWKLSRFVFNNNTEQRILQQFPQFILGNSNNYLGSFSDARVTLKRFFPLSSKETRSGNLQGPEPYAIYSV
jgi:hypothetical protein